MVAIILYAISSFIFYHKKRHEITKLTKFCKFSIGNLIMYIWSFQTVMNVQKFPYKAKDLPGQNASNAQQRQT